jgi:hypothetical protein
VLKNPALRFLNAELERITLELDRLALCGDSCRDADLLEAEYRRREALVRAVRAAAVTPEAALRAAQQKLAYATVLRDELAAAGDETLVQAHTVDVHYLAGLLTRLQAGISSETFVYSLADVERL